LPVNPPVTTQPPAATDVKTATPLAKDDKNSKPRFEFYKVLTDKDAESTTSKSHTEKTKPAEKVVAHAESKPSAGYEPQILQVGSFSNTNEAEKLKAKLALLGVEAFVQTAAIPDKGVWYRVRLGPYKSEVDMKHARSFLKQNGVESTPMHAQ
jgi:cell division protein FtsN